MSLGREGDNSRAGGTAAASTEGEACDAAASNSNWGWKQRRPLDFTAGERAIYQQRVRRSVEVLPTGCWAWGKRERGKYATVSLPGKYIVLAHRFSYAAFYGDPGDNVVRHSCDFPTCANPDHLSIGTQSDNALDSVSRGRANRSRGEAHLASRLTEDDVRNIRSRTFRHGDMSRLARDLGVSLTCIRRARMGTTWTHI